jgi:hypothetical protein
MNIELRKASSRGTNFHVVTIGHCAFWFSYSTIVAYQAPGHLLRVCQNAWSTTTGRHLNELDGGDKENRVPFYDFQEQVAALLKKLDAVFFD